MDLAAALMNVDLFKDVQQPGLRAIAAIGEPVSLAAGDVVIVDGGPADALYVISSGSCRVYKERGGDAREVVLLGPGTQFGASALLDPAARSATVVAAEPTELIAFRADRLVSLLERDPAIAATVYRALAISLFRRMRRLTDDLGLARLMVADRRGR
jgi:CRP-like cAMP-binding protein